MKSLSDFVHDLGNQVTIISGSIRRCELLLKKKQGESPIDEELAHLAKASETIAQMITLLKDLKSKL